MTLPRCPLSIAMISLIIFFSGIFGVKSSTSVSAGTAVRPPPPPPPPPRREFREEEDASSDEEQSDRLVQKRPPPPPPPPRRNHFQQHQYNQSPPIPQNSRPLPQNIRPPPPPPRGPQQFTSQSRESVSSIRMDERLKAQDDQRTRAVVDESDTEVESDDEEESLSFFTASEGSFEGKVENKIAEIPSWQREKKTWEHEKSSDNKILQNYNNNFNRQRPELLQFEQKKEQEDDRHKNWQQFTQQPQPKTEGTEPNMAGEPRPQDTFQSGPAHNGMQQPSSSAPGVRPLQVAGSGSANNPAADHPSGVRPLSTDPRNGVRPLLSDPNPQQRSSVARDPRVRPPSGYRPPQQPSAKRGPPRSQKRGPPDARPTPGRGGPIPPTDARRAAPPMPQKGQALMVRRQSPQQSSTWKTIWSKVEKGLDSLADMEDMVSDKAQKLYSTAASAVAEKVPSSVIHVPTSVFSKNSGSSDEIAKQPPLQPSPPPSALQKQARPNVVKGEEASPSALDIGMAFQKRSAAQPQQPQQQPNPNPLQAQQTSHQAGNRQFDLNAAMAGRQQIPVNHPGLIRANGGALSPHEKEAISDLSKEGSSEANRNATSIRSGSAGNTPSEGKPASGVVTNPLYQSSSTNPYMSSSSGTNPPKSKDSNRAFWQNARMVSQQQSKSSQKNDQPRRSFPDDDDDDKKSVFGKVGSIVPRIPSLASLNPLRLLGSSSEDFASATLDAWKDEEEESRSIFGKLFRSKSNGVSPARTSRSSQVKEKSQLFGAPMADLMERCQKEGKRVSLLNSKEKKICVSIGQEQAIFDAVFITCLIAGSRRIPIGNIPLPQTLNEAIVSTIPHILSHVAAAMETSAPYFFVAAFVARKSRDILSNARIRALLKDVNSSIDAESRYGMLFLRLVASINTERNMPDRMQAAAKAQIESKVDVARLQFFAAIMMLAIVSMTASFVGPLTGVVLLIIERVASMKQWHTWPLPYQSLGKGILPILAMAFVEIKTILAEELAALLADPLQFAYESSVFIALFLVTLIPKLEQARKPATAITDDDEEEEERQMHHQMTEQVWNMGASGANRIDLLSVHGRVDGILERWRAMIPQDFQASTSLSIRSRFRLIIYSMCSAVILLTPFAVYSSVGVSSRGNPINPLLQWNTLFDVAVIFYFTQKLVWYSISKTVMASEMKEKISDFVAAVLITVDERKRLLLAPPPDLKMQASISPTAGLVVKDLWAAHTTKRSWAVRGANISCKNGEIIVVLGDDGVGKSRLMMTLAEAMVSPPGRTLTTQRARGTISVSGLDVAKWDNNQLKRRLGVLLSDPRSGSDMAQMMSGQSLEEILDPCDGLNHLDLSRSPGTTEKSCMTLALKITGLYSSLLPRLPSKMSTIVTASEEDLRPSPSRPRYDILSPGEWSKLLLARTIAQTIYNNDNSIGTPDSVINCLIGSLLLLDDVGIHLSEVEENRLFADLRQSGAATVITSNRWATGRFADKILVVKDGAIIESGTHSELLNRGPRQSTYAAKWLAMTNSS